MTDRAATSGPAAAAARPGTCAAWPSGRWPPRRAPRSCWPGLGGPLPERPQRPRRGDRPAGRAGRRRAGRLGRAALLRLRGRGSLPAALAADWLAAAWDQNAACSCSARPRRSSRTWPPAGSPTCSACRPTRQHRLRHRRADGQLHRPGRGPPPRAGRRRLGRRARRPDRRAAGRGRGRGRAARHHRRRPALPRPRQRTRLRVVAGRRPGPHGRRRPARGAGRLPRGRRSSAPRPATSTPGPSTRWPRSAPPPTSTAPGCTSDGAFGLWAAASPALRHLVAGVEQADSLATDAHKWLNVPYDCGLVFVAHPDAHRAAFATAAGYLTPGEAGERDPDAYTPEFSRRARGFPIWAALRSLGRSGVADLVERGCAQARRFAAALGAPTGSTSSTRSCSTRSWSASPTPAATRRPHPRGGPPGPGRTAPAG